MIDPQLQEALDEAEMQMDAALDHLVSELATVRAGRAAPQMLDSVRVEAYGSTMPLNQVANVAAPQADLLTVAPYDKGTIGAIERGIANANLGLNPTNNGQQILISIPPLTEERRRDLAKTARTKGEEAKISIRNARRTAKDQIKKTSRAESLSEDMEYEAEGGLQEMTDRYTGRIDRTLEAKEADIMKV
ncbi:ribosome recycling factor [Rubrivirga sp. S365]|uniref:Ribosome-recycling factor n=1 Tax=Rubrivirga litoralis TaxID=3075598 RepID=A0ABU3BQI3_9BACT|nr:MULTISPECIES: ribosome recycling factor [unclassified Rubrivirga]MDT0631524.1 ribosome recycling factor [Rubrivirga sp. F394]MDT7855493.1 ribosome recycling factor [Rubrivirga sp. S365]